MSSARSRPSRNSAGSRRASTGADLAKERDIRCVFCFERCFPLRGQPNGPMEACVCTALGECILLGWRSHSGCTSRDSATRADALKPQLGKP